MTEKDMPSNELKDKEILKEAAPEANKEPKRPLSQKDAIGLLTLRLKGEESLKGSPYTTADIIEADPEIADKLEEALLDVEVPEPPAWAKEGLAKLAAMRRVRKHNLSEPSREYPYYIGGNLIPELENAINSILKLTKETLQVPEKTLFSIGLADGEFLYFFNNYSGELVAHELVGQQAAKTYVNYFNPGKNNRRTIAGRAALTREPQNVDKVGDDQDYVNAYKETNSQFSYPLIHNGELLGVVNLEHPKSYAFSNSMVSKMETIAPTLALLLHNTLQMLKEKQESQFYKALDEAGKAFSKASDLETYMSEVCRWSMAIVGLVGSHTSFSHVALYDEKSQKLRFAGTDAKDVLEKLRQGKVELNLALESYEPIGISGRAFRDGQTRIVKDVSKDPDYIEFRKSTQSQISVPLKDKDGIIGVFSIEDEHLNTFTEEHAHRLKLLAEKVVRAMRNSPDYKKQRD